MKWSENKWKYLMFFVLGSFICYLTLQWKLLKINLEVSVLEVLSGFGAAAVGLYIAHTIQKNMTKNQNQYSYIEGKLDSLWTKFSDFSKPFLYDDKIEGVNYSKFNQDINHPISFIKNIFNSFSIDDKCVNNLEDKLDEFDTYILALRKENNIIYFDDKKQIIETKILEINNLFSKILTELQKL